MLKAPGKFRLVARPAVLWLFPALLVYSAAALAQQGSAATNSSRARRVSQVTEEASPTAGKSTAQEADQYSALRAQIVAAKTPADRTRLRLELVDQLVAAGMKSEASAELRALVAEDRFDPTTFYNAGNRLVRLGDGEAAVGAYRKAIDQRNGNYARALNNLGATLLQLGRWDEAYNALSSALRLENFRYAEASFNLGRLYSVRGETDLAVREWRRALVVNPQHAGAARELANARTDGKIGISANAKTPRAGPAPSNSANEARPAKLPAKSLTLDPPAFDLLQKGRSARERGRDEEAVQFYRAVLSQTGGYFAPANLELSYSLITLKRSEGTR